jgi:hypothetical protein
MDTERSLKHGAEDSRRLPALRDQALDLITEAFANGSLSLEEYEQKAEQIQKANLPAEIAGQIEGLPQPEPRRMESPAARAEARLSRASRPMPEGLERIPTEDKSGSPEFSLCIMGDRKLRGEWLNSDQATSFTLMGSITLDLRGTTLPPGRLKIDAMAIMGEIQIIVPEGLPVKMSAFPFMGEATVKGSVEQRIVPGMPWVDVSGIALMGSIVVKVL